MDEKPTTQRSEIYEQFLSDHTTLNSERQQAQFEIYARGQSVNVNQATYEELRGVLRKFLIWQMYG